MPVKMTILFNVTTDAVNPTWSIPHSGGWSESVWYPGSSYIQQSDITNLLNARKPLLPKQAAIIGIRQGIYSIAGNKLLPQGTSGQKIILAGSSTWNVNLPQDSLELSGRATGAINGNRFRIGCLPDEMVTQGEYAPTSAYTAYVNAYIGWLSALGAAWGFIGRVLSNVSQRVISITPGAGHTATVVTSAPILAVGGTDYMRFNRVYDDNGDPVTGSYFISLAPVANTYTIQGFTGQTVAKPSGLARVDAVAFYKYSGVSVSRAVVKKVGRPSSSYRGRASRRRVA